MLPTYLPAYLPRVVWWTLINILASGTAFREIKGKLFPSVGMKKHGEHIRVNFGQSPFVYDIDGMMSVSNDSSSASPSPMSSGVSPIDSVSEVPTLGPLFNEQDLFEARHILRYVPPAHVELILRDFRSEIWRNDQACRERDLKGCRFNFAKGLIQREKAHIRNEIASTRYICLL